MTPTVIRHAQRGNRIFQVISYSENSRLMAVYQEYTVNADTGRTVMEASAPYSCEQGALAVWWERLLRTAA